MIPEIIHINVPEKFLQNVPKVHKLTLEKENEKFREKRMKRSEMKVDEGSKKERQKNSKSKEMAVDETVCSAGADKEEVME